jgi:hypothetical protein
VSGAESEDAVVCSCCARAIAQAENIWRHEVPYPGDFGTGLCLECGGDPDAKDPRKRLGHAVCTFVDARIPLVALLLSEENRKHFLSLPYEEQAGFVFRCVEKGHLL